MKINSRLLAISSGLIIAVLCILPLHAFLTVWFSSFLGHYTLLRLWDEIIIFFLGVIAIYILITDEKIRSKILSNKLFWLIFIFVMMQLLWGAIAYSTHSVNKKALSYGVLLDTRFLIFFVITWIFALKNKNLRKPIYKVIIAPAIVVILFGLLEVLVLPNNFLSHFGYGTSTIPAFQTINQNSSYIRIESTLRGSNPLGAYMLIPLSLLAVMIAKGKRPLKKSLLFLFGIIVLFFTFSRSAIIGTLLSFGVIAYNRIKSKKQRSNFFYGGIAILVILGCLTFVLRNNHKVENLVWHTQTNSSVKVSSNNAHASAFRGGFNDFIKDPIGKGPGSAGPASVYNSKPARISENNFIQIGQETGWIGFILFITINIYVGYYLYLRRERTLELSLFASLIGISFICLLSHAWTDDTLAYLWWGIAGIAIGSNSKKLK